MIFGYINILVGVAFTAFAAVIALLFIAALVPVAALAGAVREVRDLLAEYPDCAVRMLQHGFKMSNTGLKRVRETQQPKEQK